jgi:hypothetical protein
MKTKKGLFDYCREVKDEDRHGDISDLIKLFWPEESGNKKKKKKYRSHPC